MAERCLHILVVCLLLAGMMVSAVRAQCDCCALGGPVSEPQVASAAPESCCGSPHCEAPAETQPQEDDEPCDEPGGCACSFCGACTAPPVICRPRPMAPLIVQVIASLDEWSLQCRPREAIDDLLRPPQS